MRSSRQIRRNGKVERPFARRFGYETVKEGTGNLVQQAAMGLGALMGLLSSRWGLPATASVITGAIIGNAVGSIGKGFVAATVDHLRERREERAAGPGSAGRTHGGSGTASGSSSEGTVSGLHARRRGSGGFSAGRGQLIAGGGSGGIAGQVISGIERVIEEVEQTARKINAVGTSMWHSQDGMMVLLNGGREDVVRRTHDAMSEARDRMSESAVLLRAAGEDLNAYRASI
ncbi:hypothetical protein BDK92_1396 [Micromonospora pisi]|uniref:Uncharacterized protein n=1 Tax=Micromonospora pisi TaxID=589240 RepID=A0A495JE57_9ACTN|nr:hypothetical protein [Micromonospora pisi]RKR87123.1 hypothetical protein BDK92_1396 [Micromonospora pisi]